MKELKILPLVLLKKMASLSHKVIWVTGASSGIGKGLVELLATQQVKLILSSRRKEVLEALKDKLPNQDNVKVLPINLSKPETLLEKTNKALAFFKRVDVVIYSGGISQRSFAIDTTTDVSRILMEVNFFSTTIITKALLPSMIENGFGHIVPISSIVGKFGSPYRSSYAATKHALHGYYDSLRAEMWKKGVLVTIITPGFIKTNISINALTGKGEATNTMDKAQKNGMTINECGKKIIRAIIQEKEESRIGGKETIAILIKRYFPRLFSKIIRKREVEKHTLVSL